MMGSDDSLQGSSFEFYMIYRKPHPLSLSHTHTHTNTYSLSLACTRSYGGMVTKLMTLYLGFETGGRPACTCVKVVGNLRDARVSAGRCSGDTPS